MPFFEAEGLQIDGQGLLVPPQMRHRQNAIVATRPSQLAQLRAPRGQEQSPQPLWAQRGRPWPSCLVFSCRVGLAPFPLCLGHHHGKGDRDREPQRSRVRSAHYTGVERGRQPWAESCSPTFFSSSPPFLSLRQTRGLGWPWILLESRGCWLECVAAVVAPGRYPPRVAGWPAAQSSGARSTASGGSGGPVGREQGTHVGGEHLTGFWAQSTANPHSGAKDKRVSESFQWRIMS